MRTIKFRAKCAFSGVWRYGFYYVSKGNHIIRDENDKESIVLEKTLGQFTGLHDKNGKEIYKCDVLKTYPIISSDKIANDSFNVLVKFINSSWIANGVLGKRQAEISEVIGNIFDDPELVKL